MKIISWIRNLKRNFSDYEPLIEVLIYRKNLLHNLAEYRKNYPEAFLAPVLKSNAYGHGLVEVAKILDKENISFLVLDSLPEAMVLRNEGVKNNILIIGYTSANNIKNCQLKNISFAITSLAQLEEVVEVINQPVKIHLKFDTGMHRQGITIDEVEPALEIVNDNDLLEVEGVCSHLADADSLDESFTQKQITVWKNIVESIKNVLPDVKYIHLSATAGAKYFKEAGANMIRLGLGFYGINAASSEKLDLKPALSLQSIISAIKDLLPGDLVGYNATYRAKQDLSIATVPAGYFEGVDRRLSNIGYFKVNGCYCPIIGRVSMNISSVDVTDIENIKVGDKVIIISHDNDDKNSVAQIAKLANTIPWEILVHIPQHLRRIVIN